MNKTYIRRSVWENDGVLLDDEEYLNNPEAGNKDLYWYAKGVAEMQKLPLDNNNSWGFFAAMHGITMDGYDKETGKELLTWHKLIDFEKFKGIEESEIKRLIEINDVNTGKGFWNQCQHATWYFLPWHRGYLLGIETILRQHIIKLGGPDDWALPYWDYNDEKNWEGKAVKIPPAFYKEYFNKKKNPLYLIQRHPNLSNPDEAKHNKFVDLNQYPQMDLNNDTVDALNILSFTSKIRDGITTLRGFGGPETLFEHDGSQGSGTIERMPHNRMHVMIGGIGTYGLMNDPNFAALDPIFYVHHANIDRLWSVWNSLGGQNPSNKKWLSPKLDSPFIVPNPDGTTWEFTPQDVTDEKNLNYQYINSYTYTKAFDLEIDSDSASNNFKIRMEKFGLTLSHQEITDIELIGSTVGKIEITGSRPVSISIDKKNPQLKNGFKSIAQTMQKNIKNLIVPNRFYLLIEGIKGNQEGIILAVKTPNGETITSITLFGLINASKSNNGHFGQGINESVDITEYVDSLYHSNAIHEIDDLQLHIEPIGLNQNSRLSIEKITVHQDS